MVAWTLSSSFHPTTTHTLNTHNTHTHTLSFDSPPLTHLFPLFPFFPLNRRRSSSAMHCSHLTLSASTHSPHLFFSQGWNSGEHYGGNYGGASTYGHDPHWQHSGGNGHGYRSSHSHSHGPPLPPPRSQSQSQSQSSGGASSNFVVAPFQAVHGPDGEEWKEVSELRRRGAPNLPLI